MQHMQKDEFDIIPQTSYLVTGATGYIGSMLVRKLLADGHLVTALVRDKAKALEMLPTDVDILVADLTDASAVQAMGISCDYLIHCAAVTASVEMRMHPIEVTRSIVNATQNMLELARRIHPHSMVYVSTMEVYGNLDCSDGHRALETEAGHGEVDLLSARSCYPLGKRMAENLCASYAMEYSVPVKIARLAQTFGKGVLPGDNRVFAQFARAAVRGEDIVLRTTGRSMGNYCAIEDAVAGLLLILEKGRDGEAYNVANEESTMTIREMAELAANVIAGGRVGVTVDIPADNRYGYAANTGVRLSSQKLRDLGWKPTKDLRQMFLDLKRSMEEMGISDNGTI